MKTGDIVIGVLPQSDKALKLRPILLLRELPGFGDWLDHGYKSYRGSSSTFSDSFASERTSIRKSARHSAGGIVRIRPGRMCAFAVRIT
jgi:hypothetical protein